MRNPCTARELEADAIAQAVIKDVGPAQAVLHMIRQVFIAPTPRASRAALMLLRATIARAVR